MEEIEIKSTVRYCHMPIKMIRILPNLTMSNIGEAAKHKRSLSLLVGGKCHIGNQNPPFA
jgi:hypothetical protein